MAYRGERWRSLIKDDLLQNTRNDLIARAAIIFQARCCRMLEHFLPEWMTGEEAATVDGGLLLSTLTLSSKHPADRAAEAVKRWGTEKVMLPVEFKLTFAHSLTRAEHATEFYGYDISVQPEQAKAAVFVIGSLHCPSNVAVVPHWYFDRGYPDLVIEQPVKYYGTKISLLEAHADGLPAEWAPFVVPLALLPDALRNMMDNVLASRHGRSLPWCNPYNGLDFRCPVPALQCPTLLFQSAKFAPVIVGGDKRGDSTFIERLKQAFGQHSTTYRVERLLVRPLIGDFQIVRRRPDATKSILTERAAVEVKVGGALLTRAGSLHFHATSLSDTFAKIDLSDFYLFVLGATGRNEAVLVCRAEIPDEWSRASMGTSRSWKTASRTLNNTELLSRRKITGLQSNHARAIREMETMLDQFSPLANQAEPKISTRRGYKARIDKAVQVRQQKNAVTKSRAKTDEEGNARSKKGRKQREGSEAGGEKPLVVEQHFARRKYSAQEASILNHVCEKLGYGRFYYLRQHPSASYAFSLTVVDSLLNLGLRVPMVFVNFAVVNIMDVEIPNNEARTRNFFHATHGQTKSFYILGPVPYGYSPHNVPDIAKHRYVVPSELLASDALYERNDAQLQNPKTGMNRTKMPVELVDGSTIDSFAKSLEGVVEQLREVLRGPDPEQSFVGDEAGGYGKYVERAEYIVNWRHVVKEYLDEFNGDSFWTKSRPWMKQKGMGRPSDDGDE